MSNAHTITITNGRQTETMTFYPMGGEVQISHKYPQGMINVPNAKGVGRTYTRTVLEARAIWRKSIASGWKA